MKVKFHGNRVRELLLWAATGAALSAASGGALAHHAFSAEFDSDKIIEIQGVVTKVRLVNPHSWLYVDVTDAEGKVTNWGLEFGTPNALAAVGLKKEDLQPGTPVRIKGFHAKRGGPWGYSSVVTLEDGRSFRTGGAGDAPSLAAGSSPSAPGGR